MSRKHNCAHDERSRSNYASRPGMFGPHSRLEPIEGRQGLRIRQERRVEQTGVPWPTSASRKADVGNDPRAEKLLRDVFAA